MEKKVTDVKSNRAKITDAILAYTNGLPEPKSLPLDIEITIRYKEAIEQHRINCNGL